MARRATRGVVLPLAKYRLHAHERILQLNATAYQRPRDANFLFGSIAKPPSWHGPAGRSPCLRGYAQARPTRPEAIMNTKPEIPQDFAAAIFRITSVS